MIPERTQKIIFQLATACTFACAPMPWTIRVQAQEISSTAPIKNSPGMALFIPPKGWRAADQKDLSPHVKVLVIGPKLQNDMPPTMNLMIEPYDGTLKSYLKNVKKINDSHGEDWKDLGSLKTKAGDASLSQVEVRSKWGGEKLMHAIIVRNGYAYVLTATAAKAEFGRFYQQFYNALRSLQIYDNVLDLIEAPEKRASLENAYATMLMAFEQKLQGMPSGKEEIFQSADFQNNYWKPFVNMLQRDYAALGQEWQNTVLIDLKEQLMNN
jgi:hypothetical protein